MASLRKRKGSNVWQAQYYVPDAKTGGLRQVRKPTGHTNKKLTKAAAIELERTALGTIEAGTDASRLPKAVLAEAVAEIERETFTGHTHRCSRSVEQLRAPHFHRLRAQDLLGRRGGADTTDSRTHRHSRGEGSDRPQCPILPPHAPGEVWLRPRAVVCTMALSRLLAAGWDDMKHDLESALDRHLRIAIPNDQGESNWGREELSTQQLRYAADNVRHLYQLGIVLLNTGRDGLVIHPSTTGRPARWSPYGFT